VVAQGRNKLGQTKLRLVCGLAAAAAALVAVAGCDRESKPTSRTGLVACDEYFDAVDDCLAGASAEDRAVLVRSVELIRDQIAAAPSPSARRAKAEMCRQAHRMLGDHPLCRARADERSAW